MAPHPDDETLGCGGTLLAHRAAGDAVCWLIVTAMSEEAGFTPQRIRERDGEIQEVAERYGFAETRNLQLPPTRLDTVPAALLVERIGRVFREFGPEVVYTPFRSDAHSDHRHVFDAVAACTKWFRYPSVRRVLAYETLSESEFGMDPGALAFRPNVFVDIAEHLSAKIEIMRCYRSELGDFPFPRSEQAIRALASLRGSAAGFTAAEAFMLLHERI